MGIKCGCLGFLGIKCGCLGFLLLVFCVGFLLVFWFFLVFMAVLVFVFGFYWFLMGLSDVSKSRTASSLNSRV